MVLSYMRNTDPMFSPLLGKPTGCLGRFIREKPVPWRTDASVLGSDSRSFGADMRLTAVLRNRPGTADQRHPLRRFPYIEPHTSFFVSHAGNPAAEKTDLHAWKGRRICLFCVCAERKRGARADRDRGTAKKRGVFLNFYRIPVRIGLFACNRPFRLL